MTYSVSCRGTREHSCLLRDVTCGYELPNDLLGYPMSRYESHINCSMF